MSIWASFCFGVAFLSMMSETKYTEFLFSHLTLTTRSQPYIIGEDSRTDNGTLLGFHQDHHLVGMRFQQVFPEKALG